MRCVLCEHADTLCNPWSTPVAILGAPGECALWHAHTILRSQLESMVDATAAAPSEHTSMQPVRPGSTAYKAGPWGSVGDGMCSFACSCDHLLLLLSLRDGCNGR